MNGQNSAIRDRLTRDITPARNATQDADPRGCTWRFILLVILVLAAQYESWFRSMVIVLIVPMGILSALFGVWISSFPSLRTQPGF
jgi:multidrug efflux pump